MKAVRFFSLVICSWCLAGSFLYAGDTPAPLVADEGAALLRQWVQPEYPASARTEKLEGHVIVDLVVELDGTVSRAEVVKSTDASFEAAALAAVRRWTFAPALSGGKPVASALRAPVVFRLGQLKQKTAPLQPPESEFPMPLTPVAAKIKTSPDPAYPDELAGCQLAGRVDLEFTVGVDGMAHAPKVLWTSHAAFVAPALEALRKCEFEPAHQGPLLQSQVMQAPMEYVSLGVKRADVLAANHLAVAMEEKPDMLPELQILIQPVYPQARLLAGESGEATVEFTVNDRAKIIDVTLISASEPEYGAALLAAVETWQFFPGMNEDASIPIRLRVTYPFVPPVGGPVGRLVEAIQLGGAGISGAKGLDRPLNPIWRLAPTYPASLKAERPAGQAKIEFVVDEGGRVRLPRVASASHEAFGWAAATALSQWVFAPPMRDGQPVDVRVCIPVNFTPPTE